MSHESDLSFLDKPEILEIIFPIVYSPFYFSSASANSLSGAAIHFIEVEEGIRIGCGFWTRGKEFPTVLYFHGNGETMVEHGWIA